MTGPGGVSRPAPCLTVLLRTLDGGMVTVQSDPMTSAIDARRFRDAVVPTYRGVLDHRHYLALQTAACGLYRRWRAYERVLLEMLYRAPSFRGVRQRR